MKGFLAELKRRSVFRVAGIYAVVAWILAQGAVLVEAPLFLPGWFDTLVLILLILGFPLALLLSWAFDLTPEGVKRTPSVPATPAGPDALHFAPSAPAKTGPGAAGNAAAAITPATAPVAPALREITAPRARLPLPARLVGASERSPFAFFGRDAELARLNETQQASVTEQHLRVTLISGEPGIGKTTLVAQAARAIHATGANVLYGHCQEGLGVPYQPWSEALSQLIEHTDEALLRQFVDANGLALARLVPDLSRRLSLPVPEAGSDADAERFLLLERIARLLALASTHTPIMLVLDDLHWVDAASLQVLRHLVSSGKPMAVLVVGTFRESDLSRAHPLTGALAELRREPGVDRLGLLGLDDADILNLLANAAGHEMADDGVVLVQALRRETGGNPFFLLEVIINLSETGAFTQDDTGRWVLTTDLDKLDLPSSVREVVAHRVARLGEPIAQALSVAAVIGREFDLELLSTVVDVGEAQLLEIIEAATGAGLIMESGVAAGHYRFLHALIQHTLYQDLSATRRQRAHQRIAEALEARSTGDKQPVTELAHHWLAAARPTDATKALFYARRAGDAALAAFAPLDAVRWYTQAVELHARHAQGDGPRDDRHEEHTRCELLTALGAAQRQGGLPEHRDTLREAGRIALRLADPDLLIGLALSRDAGFDSYTEVDPDRLAVLEAALAAVGSADSTTRARLLACLAEELDPRDAIRCNELACEAIDMARRTGDDATLLAVLVVAMTSILTPDMLDRRLQETSVALALAERSGDLPSRFTALYHRAQSVMETGDLGEFDACFTELEAIAARTALPFHWWQVLMFRSWRHLLAGLTTEAEADSNAFLDVGTRMGHSLTGSIYGVLFLQRNQQQGRLAELVEVAARGLAENPTVPSWRMTLMSMYCELGRYDDCAALFDLGYATGFSDIIVSNSWLFGLIHYADCAAAMGRTDAAPRLYELLLPYASHFVFNACTDCGAVARPLGRLLTLLGRFEDAETHLRNALALHERLQAPYWIARTQLDLAELCLARQGPTDATTARELIAQAQQTVEQYGYAGLTPQAERLRGQFT